MTAPHVTGRADGARFTVVVKPRSSRSRVEGVREDGAFTVALKAPPVDGAANTELIRLLASALGVSKGAVRIASGERGRRKVIDVAGVSEDEVRALAR